MLTYANDFKTFIDRLDSGEPLEIDEELFDYFLEILPPVRMGASVDFGDGHKMNVSFLFAEGAEPLTAFYHSHGSPGNPRRFYARRTPLLHDGNGGIRAAR